MGKAAVSAGSEAHWRLQYYASYHCRQLGLSDHQIGNELHTALVTERRLSSSAQLRADSFRRLTVMEASSPYIPAPPPQSRLTAACQAAFGEGPAGVHQTVLNF